MTVPQPSVDSVSPDRLDRYSDMMARYLDAPVMRAFASDDVTEIYVNPQDGLLRLDTRSRGKIDTGERLDPTRVEMFLNTVAMYAKTTLGVDRPSLQAELPPGPFHGSRLQGFVPPLTCGPTFTIRKPPATVYALDHYVERGTLSVAYRDALRNAVDAHHNILVIGATNSGKTTFANALIQEMASRCVAERLVILEDTVELQCAAPDHLALRSTPGMSLAQLVKMTLRTSPDRIIVGEVRDEAALDLLDAWATGHPGGVATLHASSPDGALLRLDRLAQRANVPSQIALIAEAIQVIVVMAGGAGGRHVAQLVAVRGLDPKGRFVLERLPDRMSAPSGPSHTPPANSLAGRPARHAAPTPPGSSRTSPTSPAPLHPTSSPPLSPSA